MTLQFMIEAIGTVAFASSGAMVAIRKRLDLFGVLVLGVTTAVGGGIIRDVILQITPPGSFQTPVYIGMAAVTVGIIFLIAYLHPYFLDMRFLEGYEKLMNVLDAIGLGAFTVLKRSDFALSFSKMTFPHQLMRVVLLEQVYRGYRIMNGEPYHK